MTEPDPRIVVTPPHVRDGAELAELIDRFRASAKARPGAYVIEPLLEPRPGDQRRATRPRTTRRRPAWIGQTAIALGAFLAGLVTSSLWWLR